MGEGGVSSVWLSEGNTRQLLHCVNPLADLASNDLRINIAKTQLMIMRKLSMRDSVTA